MSNILAYLQCNYINLNSLTAPKMPPAFKYVSQVCSWVSFSPEGSKSTGIAVSSGGIIIPLSETLKRSLFFCFLFILLTWVEAGELAALFGVFAEVLAALRSLTQSRHTHLRLTLVTRAAQAGVIALRSEVEPFTHNVILDIHTRLACNRNKTIESACSQNH